MALRRPRRWLASVDPAIAALTILAFVLVFHLLGAKSLWLDEATSAQYATRDLAGLRPVITGGDPNMGLYYAMLNAWYPLLGDGEAAVRSLGAIFAALAVPVMVLLGTRLFDRRTGLVAGLMLALNAMFVQYAQTARSYGLLVLLVTLSSYFFVAELQQPSRGRRIGYVLSSSAAVYAHYFAVYVLVAHLVTLLAVRGRGAFTREWLAVALAVMVLCAPEAVVAIRAGPGGIDWIDEPSFGGLIKLPADLAGDSAPLAVALGALACYAVFRAFRGPDRWRYGFAAAWFVLPVVLAFAASFVQPMFVDQYLIVALPPLVLLAAAGLVRLGKVPGVIALGVVLLLSVGRLSDWYERPGQEDFRGAAEFVIAGMQAGDGLLFSPSFAEQPFCFYGGRPAAAGLSRVPYRGGAVITDAPRIWLVTRRPDTPLREQRRIEADIASAGYERVHGLPSFVDVGVVLFEARSADRYRAAPLGAVDDPIFACTREAASFVNSLVDAWPPRSVVRIPAAEHSRTAS